MLRAAPGMSRRPAPLFLVGRPVNTRRFRWGGQALRRGDRPGRGEPDGGGGQLYTLLGPSGGRDDAPPDRGRPPPAGRGRGALRRRRRRRACALRAKRRRGLPELRRERREQPRAVDLATLGAVLLGTPLAIAVTRCPARSSCAPPPTSPSSPPFRRSSNTSRSPRRRWSWTWLGMLVRLPPRAAALARPRAPGRTGHAGLRDPGHRGRRGPHHRLQPAAAGPGRDVVILLVSYVIRHLPYPVLVVRRDAPADRRAGGGGLGHPGCRPSGPSGGSRCRSCSRPSSPAPPWPGSRRWASCPRRSCSTRPWATMSVRDLAPRSSRTTSARRRPWSRS